MSGSMPIRVAQALVFGCIDALNKVAPGTIQALIAGSDSQLAGSTRIMTALGEVETRVGRLIAGGYKLERLQSTRILVAETVRKQEEIRNLQFQVKKLQGEQKARLLALKAGLSEVQ